MKHGNLLSISLIKKTTTKTYTFGNSWNIFWWRRNADFQNYKRNMVTAGQNFQSSVTAGIQDFGKSVPPTVGAIESVTGALSFTNMMIYFIIALIFFKKTNTKNKLI